MLLKINSVLFISTRSECVTVCPYNNKFIHQVPAVWQNAYEETIVQQKKTRKINIKNQTINSQFKRIFECGVQLFNYTKNVTQQLNAK